MSIPSRRVPKHEFTAHEDIDAKSYQDRRQAISRYHL